MVVFDIQRYQALFKQMGYDDDSGAMLLLRTQLLKEVKTALEEKDWTKKEAAQRLGVKQPRISEIYALRIDKFSVELLIKYLHRLGKEVTFSVNDLHR